MAFWPNFCLRQESFSGSGLSRPVSGAISAAVGCPVVGVFSKRLSFPLTESCFCSGPFAPRSLPASSLLGAGPTPDRGRPCGYLFPPRRWSRRAGPPRRASQVPRLICLRAPSPTTPRSPAVACAHCFTTSVRFHPHRKTDHFPFALTRPKRVHLRYGSRIRRSRLRPAGLLPLTLDWLPVERAITGQAPFSLQDQARLILAQPMSAPPAQAALHSDC